MSKLKRKWLRVLEYEETGRPLDETTRDSLLETHPDLPLLHDEQAMPPPPPQAQAQHETDLHPMHYSMPPTATPMMQMTAPQVPIMHSPYHHIPDVPIEPQIDSQLEQQLQREIASADGPRV